MNIPVKIVDCQIIGPAAAGSAGYVASPMYIYYYIFLNFFPIYIIPRTVLAMVTPTPSPLAVSKSNFFTSHVFSGVHLFAYRFRRLLDGFRPYNIFEGTLTSGLRYHQHLTVL